MHPFAWRFHLKSTEILSLLCILVLQSPTSATSSSWVEQSFSPFNIEDDFKSFVKSAGGHSEQFKFLGNFNSAENTNVYHDQIGHFETAANPITKLDHIPIYTPKHGVNGEIHTALTDRIPRNFYKDIFDHSIPTDSPYHTQFNNAVKKTRRKPKLDFYSASSFASTKLGKSISSKMLPAIQQPAVSSSIDLPLDFGSTDVEKFLQDALPYSYQQVSNDPAAGYASQVARIGRFEKPRPSQHHRLRRKRPLKRRPVIVKAVQQSLTTESIKSPGQLPATPSVSFNSPKHSVQTPEKHDFSHPIVNSVNDAASGCTTDDGAFRHAGDIWYSNGCRRHSCIQFRGRHFIETDACSSKIRTPSYRCVILMDHDAPYPHCCPRYKCNPDNLGRPDSKERT